ncbi:MAG TPA: PH domain-containing protein [Gemmata sp.]|nr:PH domain-containing protein [Gemmata sp.]
MGTERPTRDPAQADLAWFGYHPRAMLPAITLAAVGSLIVWTGRWYFDDLSDLAEAAGNWAVFALAWAIWPALALAFLYKTVLHTYRLTDRAVLVEYGFLSRPVTPVLLTDVAAVVVGGRWLLRQIGVGWVEVRTANRAVRLTGVRNPGLVAEQIRAARARTAGGGQATA